MTLVGLTSHVKIWRRVANRRNPPVTARGSGNPELPSFTEFGLLGPMASCSAARERLAELDLEPLDPRALDLEDAEAQPVAVDLVARPPGARPSSPKTKPAIVW